MPLFFSSRQCWIQAIAAGAFLAASVGLRASESAVIAVIGDFGGAATSAVTASNELAVANLVRRWNPDFIITTGDNNYPEGAASTIDINIGQFYHDFIHPYLGIYGGGAASNRFFPCLGNHDWVSNGLPSLNYFALPGNERYYSHRAGPVEVFAINSNPDPDGTSSTSIQGQWLHARLTNSTARWKLVYLHHPPYSSDPAAGNPGFRWPYAAWGATAVLAGHEHNYARIHTNGIVYFINGLGGEEIHPVGSGLGASAFRYSGDFGAMRIQATETNLVFHFITRNNVVMDAHVVGAPLWTPFILVPPVDRSVPVGRPVTFNVQATGAGGLRYQWQFYSANIPNATNSLLIITNAQGTDEGDYSVIVSSGTSATRSATARLSVLRHPLITQQPQNQAAVGGATVLFRVMAEGAGALRYQWFFNGETIPGGTGDSLTVTNVQLSHTGLYTVLVTDDVGSILSNPAALTVKMRPVVTLHPVGQSMAVGGTVVFSVSAVGTLPMGYSWRRDGRVLTNIVLNESTCFWAVANVQFTNAGNYQVGITNPVGPASSLTSNAVLTVLADLDGDGMPDAWELANGLKPEDAGDAALDPDGDGQSNYQEYLAGTDPNSPESSLRIERFARTLPAGTKIEFTAISNRTYAVEFRDESPAGEWRVLAEFTATATNRVLEHIGPIGTGGRRFYRLVTPRLP